MKPLMLSPKLILLNFLFFIFPSLHHQVKYSKSTTGWSICVLCEKNRHGPYVTFRPVESTEMPIPGKSHHLYWYATYAPMKRLTKRPKGIVAVPPRHRARASYHRTLTIKHEILARTSLLPEPARRLELRCFQYQPLPAGRQWRREMPAPKLYETDPFHTHSSTPPLSI